MKLIASDFDGTIFIDGKIKTEDIEAIRDFQDKGNLFGLVTGRTYHSLFVLIEGKIDPDFIIANNGSHIFVKNGTDMIEILKYSLDQDKLRDVIDYYGRTYPTKIFTDKDREVDRLEDLREGEEILSLAIYSDHILENPFQEDFSFHKSIGVIDVINSAVSKQTGIEFIKDFYGFDKEIIAIGDDFNDISFLEQTRLSFSLNYVKEKEVLDAVNFKVEGIRELIENIDDVK
ncbi:phosphoglycolate phosphatase [Anaerococcus prevotii]|uniref:HAD-superfamily hydrolase, subfamily IIB n=1 Tax=Anaerococcus prevotii (strain ATCC 9321 / DSM 20548 / JCM 6508 / NCTC 11806 / PC1) TaxID=525919 RepID=C7RG70_ANAPD|nr:HAD-IIB family hydrolase [Anaerococcus prevotii]ACV28481.1 HAD-superfamily hydrolase, subfamily IIB [Anaerococcus prevotii DSM 20548]SUU94040.1 phosphoglycolate phosphatase [Anaerococcus prevotii]